MAASPLNTILVVEDDAKTASLVSLYLRREGFNPVTAHDGSQVARLFARFRPIFVILDLMLPGIDGWEICRDLRRRSNVPILILTARREELDRVLGLTLGADDYVVKPFSPRELVARVRAILRRAGPRGAGAGGPLRHRGLVLDPDRHRVALDGRRIALTLSEFRLLQTLMGAPGRVFTRQELLGPLYPQGASVIDRVVDVHIGKLRQKIEDDPASPRHVLTVRGIGYQLAGDD